MHTEIKETKKIEKLASAVYILTSFLSDLEPMKWRLRELAGKLVNRKENGLLIEEIMSLLTVSKNAGLISDMNHEIIHREFSLVLPQRQTIGDIFKQIERHEEPTSLSAPVEQSVVKQTVYLSSSLANKQERTIIKDRIIKETKSEGDPRNGVVALKKNGRQGIILNLLKRKKEIMIKDVSPLIEGVSEKTIQRELLSLVKTGILLKVGEKRWSRYSLAHA